jgi:hypothetical protein
MSEQKLGFFFSCNADLSEYDHTIYVQYVQTSSNTIVIGARYKSCDPNHLYEIEMDTDDLRIFGQMCRDLACQIESGRK